VLAATLLIRSCGYVSSMGAPYLVVAERVPESAWRVRVNLLQPYGLDCARFRAEKHVFWLTAP
jgi:hypothetical protein